MQSVVNALRTSIAPAATSASNTGRRTSRQRRSGRTAMRARPPHDRRTNGPARPARSAATWAGDVDRTARARIRLDASSELWMIGAPPRSGAPETHRTPVPVRRDRERVDRVLCGLRTMCRPQQPAPRGAVGDGARPIRMPSTARSRRDAPRLGTAPWRAAATLNQWCGRRWATPEFGPSLNPAARGRRSAATAAAAAPPVVGPHRQKCSLADTS